MDNILISVCIPVYNGELFIERCLDSVIAQKIDSIEIVLVDDGSTDGTLRIMKGYKERFSEARIKVIEQKHMGLAQGRCTGVNNSVGEYVTFLDADDYLIDGSYKTILRFMKNHKADIYEFQTIREGYCSRSPYSGIMKTKIVLKDYFDGIGIPVNYWLRWYKRELFTDRVFPKGISIHEDVYGFPCVLNNADSIAYIAKPLHVHTNDNSASVMNQHNAKRNKREYFDDQKVLLLSIKHIENNIGLETIKSEFKESFNHYIIRLFRNFVFMDCPGVSYHEKLKAIIETMGLSIQEAELESYISQGITKNCKLNIAIRYLGLHNAYLLHKLKNQIRATTQAVLGVCRR